MERIRDAARAHPRRLLLVEGDDARVLAAAARLARERLADPTLLGDSDRAAALARGSGLALEGVRLEDGADPAIVEFTREALRRARGDRLEAAELERVARDPLYQAAARVAAGEADCCVAGAVRTSADVVRAALWLIGTAEGVRSVSSFFVMVVPGRGGAPERILFFADCGVIPDPDASQLAEIAVLTSEAFERLTGERPRTAFLSFSTQGSARHPRVDKVREALATARRLRPDGLFDGELQADAALDPEVAARKTSGGPVAGHADVLVFPDLDSGNIGYKLVQRLAGAEAYGPILQGLRRPMTDLSRGCSEDDVVHVATIACALAPAAARNPMTTR